MRVHWPEDGHFADACSAMVLFNQFGAIESQDAGRDAQVLADSFKIPVLAVDRPGTAVAAPNRRLARALSTPDGYLAQMFYLGNAIDKRFESLGVSKVIATGRSAGGLGALALARSETVSSMNAVFAAEPVGCERLPLKQGAKRYSDYLKSQKELRNAATPGELVEPLPPGLPPLPAIGRLLSIPPSMLFDRYHNQRIFASDAARQYASYIAENLNMIDATLEFAEHSMVATPEVYERDIIPIATLRTSGAPFEVKQPKGTVHSSFDNREYMNKVIQPTVDRTLVRI